MNDTQTTRDLTLWYRQPAQRRFEALPLGNGRLGAMVYGGVTHEHRHTSHLVSVFPFHQVNPDDTPELAQAAQVSIARRTTPKETWEDTGWARSMLMLYAARLRDAETAHGHILDMQRTLTEQNLFVFHPPAARAGWHRGGHRVA